MTESTNPRAQADARDGDPRGSNVARHRTRVDPHQGVPGRRGSDRRARRRQPRVGEPLRRPRLDLFARGRLVGTPGGVRRPRRRRATPLRRAARDVRCDRRVRDDARLPRVRRGRRAARAVPHVAQHLDGAGGRRAQRAVRRQHPAAVVDRPPAPGDPRRGAPRPADRLRHHARRLRALAAHGPQGDRRGRRLGDVPDRLRDGRLRRAADRGVRRAGRRPCARDCASPNCFPRCCRPDGRPGS